jgi:hypothetical protein
MIASLRRTVAAPMVCLKQKVPTSQCKLSNCNDNRPIFKLLIGKESSSMLRIYDLDKVQKKLPAKFKIFRNVCRQLISAYTIHHDLRDSSQALETFFEWYEKEMLPSRKNGNDAGRSGLIGRSLFCLAALHLCRALDVGSSGRTKVDFRSHFKSEGLIEIADEITRFRNTDLAHYDGFEINDRRYTDDRTILVAQDYASFLKPVFTRTNSSGELASKMTTLTSSAKSFIVKYANERHRLVFEKMQQDSDLRNVIKTLGEDVDFNPYAFFTDPIEAARCFDPEGPIASINW